MAYFSDDPKIRADMNDVRRNLARVNPHGFSCPLEVHFSDTFSFTEDLLPLYYCSPVIRKLLEKLPERPSTAKFVVHGSTDPEAFKILIAYANGSSRTYNWVADLAQRLHLAAYVWELAVVYQVTKLEEFTREIAFDDSSGALNSETVIRLFLHADHIPKYKQRAFKYICYNLPALVVLPPTPPSPNPFPTNLHHPLAEDVDMPDEQLMLRAHEQHDIMHPPFHNDHEEEDDQYNDDPDPYRDHPDFDGPLLPPTRRPPVCPDFGYLSYAQLKEILTSVHLRATQEHRFAAITKWHQFRDPAKDFTPEQRNDRDRKFYKLTSLIYYPLVDPRRQDVMQYRDYNMELVYGLPPRPADARKRARGATFTAFKLDDLLDEVRHGREFYEPPRLKGLFKAFHYYWQLEVPWSVQLKSSSVSVYLRLLHGSDRAGAGIGFRETAGVMTKFIIRLHCSDNFDKCYRQTECIHVDMMNLPAGHKMYGVRPFLSKNSCKYLLSLKHPKVWISVEILDVREIAARR